MSNSATLVFLLVAGALTPGAALGQGPMELAIAGPQPHFVAAWAPKKEREAERSAVLAGRVSLELRDVSLDAALKALTNQAGLRITYSRAMLPPGKRVTINASDVAVVTAMTEMLFRSGLDVVVDRDGALALVRCRHEKVEVEAADSGAIVGLVTDNQTGAAIYGATVVVEGTSQRTTTDSEGRYRITGVVPGTYTLRVRYIGYKPAQLVVTVGRAGDVSADVGLERSVQKLDELVTVTPGGMQTVAKALPNPVSVITAEEIAERHPQAFSDVLRQFVPTAVAFHHPTVPIQTNISVRGVSSLSSTSNMKVFIDGVEASSFGLSAVDPASIERLEVVRGPQASTVYGADAAGGVLQVFTKRGDPSLPRPEVNVAASAGITQTPYEGFGSVLRQQYRASVNGGNGDVSYNFGGGYERLGEWLPLGATSHQVTSPSVYGGTRYSRGMFAADFSARYYHNSLPADQNPLIRSTGFLPESRPNLLRGDYSNETYGARLSLAPTESWRHNLTLGVDRTTSDFTQTGRRLTTAEDTLLSLITSSSEKSSIQYATSVDVKASAVLSATLTGGVDHYKLNAASTLTLQGLNTIGTIQTSPPGSLQVGRSVTTNTGYFFQASANWREMVFLTAGLRADNNSAFGADVGTRVYPRVGLSFVREVGQTTLKLRGAYGRAFRAPAAGLALGAATPTFVTLPNPLLAPERQRGWEAGLDVAFASAAQMSVTAFDQVAENLIASVFVTSTPAFSQQWQNVGRVTNRGVEVEGSLRTGALRFTAQYGYVRSRIEDLGAAAAGNFLQVGDEPRYTPTHTAGGSVTASPWPSTTATLGVTYVGDWREFDLLAFYRCFGGTGDCRPDLRDYIVDFPGFAKFNLAIGQRLTHRLEGSFAVENLTNNEAYESGNTLPVMGRTTMVGLRFRY